MKNKITLCILCGISIYHSLAQGQVPEWGKRFSFENDIYTTVLASIGEHDITVGEFIHNYEFGPAFLKRQANSKRRYLQLMIYEKLLALEGYSQGLHTDPEVKRSLAEIEGDLMTEALYKEDVLSKISITEEETNIGKFLTQQELFVKWIYAKNQDELADVLHSLKNESKFDSLFLCQLNDSVLLEDRSWKTNRFQLLIKNTVFSEVVDTLGVGNISPPIKTKDGWYLVKIEEAWESKIITKSEGDRLRQRVRTALITKKAESKTDEYIRTMMLKVDPLIVRSVFDVLRYIVGRIVLPENKIRDWNLSKNIDFPSADTEVLDIRDYFDRTLVRMKGGRLTLKDFWMWYDARKSGIKFDTSSPQQFFICLQQYIWRMVRDRLLIDYAANRGFGQNSSVLLQKKWWMDKIVFAAKKNLMANSVQLTEDELRDYYRANQQSYQYRNGNVIPFEKAKKRVENDFYREKYISTLYHEILRLKQKYPIEINQKLLMDIEVEDQCNPRAIDVYYVKNGGTLPRPAFPTIDWEWQSFYE